MGDTKYFKTVLLSVKQSEQFYMGRRFLIYDWGFEEDQLDTLSSFPGVEIIPWRNRLINADRLFANITPIKKFIKKNLLRQPDYTILKSRWQRELYLNEKCYCILDAAVKINGPFLFLDADAFIVNRIDELINIDCDVIVTLRPLEEIERARRDGVRHEINSGVILFNKNKNKVIAFIIEWIKEMNIESLKREPLSEQTGLSDLILKGDGNAFTKSNNSVEILIGDLTIKCRIVPTINYNYNSVEDGFDPNINRILHLKRGRGFTTVIDEIEAKLKHHN